MLIDSKSGKSSSSSGSRRADYLIIIVWAYFTESSSRMNVRVMARGETLKPGSDTPVNATA
jgi:hypothetical protein